MATILVISDDQALQDFVASNFLSHEVLPAASDALAGSTSLSTFPEGIDLVIVKRELGGAMDVVRTALSPNTAIIVLSEDTSLAASREAIEAGVNIFLPNSVDLATFRAVIEGQLAGR